MDGKRRRLPQALGTNVCRCHSSAGELISASFRGVFSGAKSCLILKGKWRYARFMGEPIRLLEREDVKRFRLPDQRKLHLVCFFDEIELKRICCRGRKKGADVDLLDRFFNFERT